MTILQSKVQPFPPIGTRTDIQSGRHDDMVRNDQTIL